MYTVAVPITNKNVTRFSPEMVYEELRKLDAGRVFLAIDRYVAEEKSRVELFSTLEKNCRFFKEKGYEVGVWIWAFMFSDSPYRCMKSLSGKDYPENMCPSDGEFLEFAASFVCDMARAGVDIIMYDDDLRYGFLGDEPACVCDGHMKLISDIVGEEVTREFIREKVYSGGRNKYRDAYIKANGEFFRRFAHRMREALDSVNPDIRMGACSCMSSWDLDGVQAQELAVIFAGKTKPFVRLIGAPYWAAAGGWGNSLQDVIELSRMECAWMKKADIEIFSEGDVYPRPRTSCPSSYLECFDIALRAAGCTDGILKYGLDYNSSPCYEQGYAIRHMKNRGIYEEVEKYFSGKECVGVRVYEYPEKLRAAQFREKINIENMFFSLAARTLSYNSIPTVYEGTGITGAAFGENARHLPLNVLSDGLILDISASEILSSRGVDTGVSFYGEKISAGAYEEFTGRRDRIGTYGLKLCDISLDKNAEVLSFTEVNGRKIPVSFRYENSLGQRFFVLNCYTDINNTYILKHYERNRQYTENILWLSGRALPVSVSGHPALYIMVKEGKDGLSVGLWNLFADEIISPQLYIRDSYRCVNFINTDGRLCGNKLLLNDIPAFGFAAFELLK
ncbi:MAG: hypothetical protein IJO68_06920 [Clostridia bacterium]|nr:hypothetical protein [Clostridia bacterium]